MGEMNSDKIALENKPQRPESEQITFRSHQEGVEYLAKIATKLGTHRVQIPQEHFESFKPDLLIGTGTKERIVVDYIHTFDSFPRDYMGMLLLLGEHRAKGLSWHIYHAYYLALCDDPVFKQTEKMRSWLLHVSYINDHLFMLPCSEFEKFLSLEIQDIAKRTLERLRET